jgi:hypothetical protein
MPKMGFEPTVPVFERVKTVHASDRAATVIGKVDVQIHIFLTSTLFRVLCVMG